MVSIYSTIKYVFLFSACLLLFSACSEKKQSAPPPTAQIYCGGCHALPDPKLLDKKTWQENIFPRMAIMMGLRPMLDLQSELDYDELIAIQEAHLIPEKPMLSEAEYQELMAFYVANAPDNLPPAPHINYQNLAQFSPKVIPVASKGNLTLLKCINKKLYLGDRQNEFFVLNQHFELESKTRLESTPSGMIMQPNGNLRFSLMGKMDPTNLPTGSVTDLNEGSLQSKTKITGLNRPVSMQQTDLDQDGKADLLVAGFGHYLGRLSWFSFPSENKPVEHILKQNPGALNTFVRDFNGDKIPDVMVLMAQGNEGVSIFYGKGKDKNGEALFEEKQVLQFPSVYGSSNIELVDFDADGHEDILYANGDNGDLSQILKPYHGVRIFMNNGKNEFKEKYFFPMNGATKAIATDFDGDGDQDIAAIAFFADFTQQPQKGFVYLENKGKLSFTPQIETKTDENRWLLMESGDFDGDGDSDILLGSCRGVPLRVPKAVSAAWQQTNTKLLLLENKSKTNKNSSN